MKALLSAFWPFWQASRLLTFRSGAPEVPTKTDFDFLTLVTLSAAIGTARWGLFDNEITPPVLFAVYMLQSMLALLFASPRSVSIMALCLVGTNTVATALNFAGMNANEGVLNFATLAWGLFAYIAASRPARPSKASRENTKN
ncbi:hypothetical protein AB4Y45_34075 [Paraburkholderia sp. EG287A]|uniref:hypothetical protein n=1 Tax=Paraburkholderia sp. EG287A TaxID=3237012 RepID=UPI0034D233C9